MSIKVKIALIGSGMGKSRILEVLQDQYEIVHIIHKNPDPPKIACGFGTRTGARRAQRNGKPWERR